MSGVVNQCISHRDMLWDVLKGLNQEINPAILEELKPIFLILELDVTTEVFGVKTVTELYNVLLRHYNNDFRKVVLAMREVFPVVVKDSDELEDDLICVCNQITEEYEEVGLPHDSVLYGRDTEMEKLLSYLDFNKDVNTRLINVCGMAGIRKSFLVRHLALNLMDIGEIIVIYLDFSQVKGKVRGNMVLILDDLASHMTCSNEARDVLKLFNDIFLRVHRFKNKLKIVVTSRTQMALRSDQVTEQPDLSKLRNEMKDYTKDVPLSRLSDDDSLNFLNSSLHNISYGKKDILVKYCNGHPYLLQLLREKASREFSLTAEVTNLTTIDLEADGAILTKLFPSEYESLTGRQQDVLLTVGVYGQDITLKALYEIVEPPCHSKVFYAQVKQDFHLGFWLRVKIFNDIKCQATSKTMLGVHHPLIMKFLQSQIQTHLEESENSSMYQRIIMMKDRYVRHIVSELVMIGRDLMFLNTTRVKIDGRPPADNNLKLITERVSLMKSTFKLMTTEIADSADPGRLLFTPDEVALRSESDIAHLFLCVFEYYDCFDGSLMKMLRNTVHKPTNDPANKALMWTLYLLALTQDKDYRTIQIVIEKPMANTDPKLLITRSQGLYHFCKALNNFVHSVYLVRAPWLKERIDVDLFANRDKVSTTAQHDFNRKYLSMDWSNVRTYFSVHLTIAQAEAKKSTEPRSIDVISQAFSICRKAEKEIERVPLIEPAVYEYMAELKSLEGCQEYHEWRAVGKTIDLFDKSRLYRNKALDVIKKRKMERSAIGVRNRLAYAILLRSWASVIADNDQRLDQAIDMLEKAIIEGENVVATEELLALGTTSKRMLYRAYEDHGICYAYLAQFYRILGGYTEAIYVKRYSQYAYNFLDQAYNLIRHKYRNCHFSANDATLERLIHIFPKVMRSVGIVEEIKERATKALLMVQNLSNKEADEGISLSDSEAGSFSSSEAETSDDETDNNTPSQPAAPSDEASSDVLLTKKQKFLHDYHVRKKAQYRKVAATRKKPLRLLTDGNWLFPVNTRNTIDASQPSTEHQASVDNCPTHSSPTMCNLACQRRKKLPVIGASPEEDHTETRPQEEDDYKFRGFGREIAGALRKIHSPYLQEMAMRDIRQLVSSVLVAENPSTATNTNTTPNPPHSH